ncbi:hypothetical protein [Pseudomonas putida]|uniref:Uncharacterized protein n=1 Tax=Pseudomonas putida TaxID=303 RepID=A0A6S5TJV6_PSEPU|nr:hypothetical protein [Pseudomonas putida]BBT40720.1 hypothetical protein WP8W18C01_30610 [Pseudomonas putida]
MGLLNFLKKRKQPEQKSYPLTKPEVMDLVTDVCSALGLQYRMLENCGIGAPPLFKKNSDNDEAAIDLWLAGYISGFYDASSQCRGVSFELNALELIFSVLYNEHDAEFAIREYHIARMSLESDRAAAVLFGYDEFEEGMLAGGNEVYDWANNLTDPPFKLYKKYS